MKSRQRIPLGLMSLGVALFAMPAIATPPTTYTADSTTNVYAKPSVTDSGAFDLNLTDCPTHGAGYKFTPTDFYCQILRVTDPNTDTSSGNTGKSYFGPGSWMQSGWNCTSTFFYIQNNSTRNYVYAFSPGSFTATLQAGTYTGLTSWDPNHTTICWGIQKIGSDQWIVQWDFSTIPATVTKQVVDVTSYLADATEILESHISDGLADGGTASLKVIAVTGGTGAQGTDHEILWYDTTAKTGLIYHTDLGTITDLSGNSKASGIMPNGFGIHQASVTKDGRYVWVSPEGTTSPSGPVIWDTTNNTVIAMANYTNGGHMAVGWGEVINDVYDHVNTYWWYRKVDSLTDIQNPVSLVSGVPSTMNQYDDHPCWNNAQAGTNIPVFTSTIQPNGTYNQSPPCYGDEIIAVATANRTVGSTNTIWRFAHHRSTITAHTTQDDYYANGWGNVSQDGKWVMFQSNWEETLGTRTGSSDFRDDVFIVKLAQSAH